MASPFTKFELLEPLLLGASTARPARSESMDDDWERCDAEAVVTALSARYRFSRANAVQLLRDEGILRPHAEARPP